MPRLFPIVLVVLLLAATGFGAAQLIESRKLRLNEAALAKEREDLRKRVWDLQKQNADLTERLGRGRAGAGELVVEEPAGVIVAEGGPAGTTDGPVPRFRQAPDFRRGFDALNSPEVQQLMNLQQRAALDGNYAALFRNLNLSPAELEKFKQLLVEKQSSAVDVMAAARSQGVTGRENRDELRGLLTAAQAEVDESIRAAIGESAYAQYKNYEATLPQRGMVDQLERRLSYSGAPLSSSQVEQVVQILAETSPQPARGGRSGGVVSIAAGAGPLPAVFVGGGTRISEETITRAQGVLQPQQLAALEALRQEQLAAQQLQQQLRAGRRNANSSTNETTPAAPVPPPRG